MRSPPGTGRSTASAMTGVTIGAGIPIEELVFFLVVPFAAVLTLEAVRSVRGWSVGDEPPGERPVTYTQLALLGVALTVLLDLMVLRTRLLLRRAFWVAYAIIVFFQLLTNGILTGFEIVRYSGDRSSGRRRADLPRRWTHRLCARRGSALRIRTRGADAHLVGVVGAPGRPVPAACGPPVWRRRPEVAAGVASAPPCAR